MDWILDSCVNKKFWHITTNNNAVKIKNDGLEQSKTGQNGKGLYCIDFEDYEVLDSLIELMEQRGEDSKNLSIIEFYYSGEFEFCKKDMFLFSNEGWVVIRNNIETSQIEKILKVDESN